MKIKELFEEEKTTEYKNTKALIDKWLLNPDSVLQSNDKKILDSGCIINNDGSIEILNFQRLIIINEMLNEKGEFPFPIKAASQIVIAADKIASFKNFPEEVKVSNFSNFPVKKALSFSYATMNNLTSFEYFPKTIVGSVNFAHRTPNLSFSRIDKYIKYHKGVMTISPEYKGPLLSFLKIEGETVLMAFNSSGQNNINSKIIKAIQIVNKHLETRNVLACQDELLENGLKEYAKL